MFPESLIYSKIQPNFLQTDIITILSNHSNLEDLKKNHATEVTVYYVISLLKHLGKSWEIFADKYLLITNIST